MPVLSAAAAVTAAQGQLQPAVESNPVSASAVAEAPPGPDPKLIKQYESILNQKFTRDANELLRHLERFGASDPATLPANDRFLLRFVTGDWNHVRDELAGMPPELAVRIYNKMLSDLTENRKPVVRLDDVMALADAAPGELTNDNIRKLGQLLGIAVPANEAFWLADRLQKGTGRFGGSDSAKRLLAARLLIAGNFRDLARSYLPPADQLEQISDESVRGELQAFAATQEQRETAQRSEVQRIWDENIRELFEPGTTKGRGGDKSKAVAAIAKVVAQVPQSTLAPVLAGLVRNHPDSAIKLLTALVRKVQGERNSDVPARTANLTVQANVATLLCDLVNPGEQPWTQMLEMMADTWSGEAENSFAQKAVAGNQQQRFVLPEDLLPNAPAGKWAAALSESSRDRIDVCMSRLILSGANFDQAADRIVDIGKRSALAGAALAEDFLGVWARTHNPQIPEALRRKFSLPEDARIPVTPIMMEKNIDSLARMMAQFRQAGIAPADYTKVVDAFDLAYSSAETYRTSHIEKVFGSMDKMDEPLFFLILSRMGKNLSQRWRTMDAQQAGMTQRDEKQTLELVREGYATALKLIDQRAEAHAGSSRALTLAGTLLVDWGDFEFFQDLVVSDSRIRIMGYKEKNLQAQDYFNRGAAAYGRQVARMAASDYNVDAYVGWFHGLLGIGSNGQINLSKAMNRAALNRIREHMTALPGKAAKAHISMFAKMVNDRLNDEKDPLHEDLRYRYLASALIITQDDPFTLGAQKKVAYLDELLSEVRLQTRVDGSTTIGRDQDFGIVVSSMHTEAMGRAANFGQYLTNDPNAGTVKPKKQPPLVKKMRAAEGPRDELELNITEALSPFFDIKSITFATPDVRPRPTAQPGWDETILAYLHVRVKDASVDKIPPVQLDLKFIDLSGPVTIPAESAETLIKVNIDNAPPRPASNIEITQTLDARQLFINGSLTLEIKATSSGLVPGLHDLLDFNSSNKIATRNVNAHEGLQITELNTWGDQVAPRSERLWTISLDGDEVRSSEVPLAFHFPQPKAEDAAVTYQTYADMNLTVLQTPVIQVGREPTAAEAAVIGARRSYRHYALAGGGLFLLALILGMLLRRKARTDRPVRARDVFAMPAEVDGFAVVALLRRLRASPLVKLKDIEKSEMQRDLHRVEQACFGADGGALSESDLRNIAAKWLRSAT